MLLPSLTFRNSTIKFPIIQGGMGIGYANHILSGNVSKHGGMGVISSAALDRLVTARTGEKHNCRRATEREILDTKKIAEGNPIGINIMVAIVNQYENSVLGAMDGGVDAIISGAGLPTRLAEIAQTHPRANEVALIPIVSSARALKIILRKWAKAGRVPDAVVVEGPLAGGHIGWAKRDVALSEENKLENLCDEVIELAKEHGIPVIAAGGIHNNSDIKDYLARGCAGVQMGTRFLATEESGASKEYKEQLVKCKEEDIALAEGPGSPCGLLFRVLKQSPFYIEALSRTRPPLCNKSYLLVKGECDAKTTTDSFCICNGLVASSYAGDMISDEKELYSVGARAHELTEITTVEKLMIELTTDVSCLKKVENQSSATI